MRRKEHDKRDPHLNLDHTEGLAKTTRYRAERDHSTLAGRDWHRLFQRGLLVPRAFG